MGLNYTKTKCSHRKCTELWYGWGWQTSLEVIWSSLPTQAWPPRVSCPGPPPDPTSSVGNLFQWLTILTAGIVSYCRQKLLLVHIASVPMTEKHWKHSASNSFTSFLQVFEHSGRLFLSLYAEQCQLLQPLLLHEVLQSPNHPHGPLLKSLQCGHLCLVLKSTELDPNPRCGLPQCWVKGQGHLWQLAGNNPLNAPQNTIGLLGHKGTLLVHVQLDIHKDPQASLHRAVFQSISPPACTGAGGCFFPGAGLSVSLGWISCHSWQPILLACWDHGRMILWCISCSSQFCVICELAEGMFQLINEDVKYD